MSRAAPYQLLVMGVAGCGKSTLAAELARALGCVLIEGDDHHPAPSQEKMRAGIALDDADRAPWLAHLGTLLADASGGAVLTCSALKRRYRDQLRAAAPALAIVFIDISPAQAHARVAARTDHLFPPGLVDSQFEALESPLGEAGVLHVEAMQPLTEQLDANLRWLDHPIHQTAQPTEENLS
ncbi:MAG: gluconokinase [Rhodoferax sp.]